MDKKIVRTGIGVFIFKDGKFLMGQRRNSHGDGTWSIPGGHLEFGETFEDAAKREVLEETGLKIKNIRFGAVTNDYFKKENKHYVTVWVLSDWESGEAYVVAYDLDKFLAAGADIDPTGLANKLLESGWAYVVADNLDKFLAAGADPTGLANKLLESDRAYVVADNLDKFVAAGADESALWEAL